MNISPPATGGECWWSLVLLQVWIRLDILILFYILDAAGRVLFHYNMNLFRTFYTKSVFQSIPNWGKVYKSSLVENALHSVLKQTSRELL